jgi:hypothetical protein
MLCKPWLLVGDNVGMASECMLDNSLQNTSLGGSNSKVAGVCNSKAGPHGLVVLLLSIFRRAPHPSASRGALVPFYFPG